MTCSYKCCHLIHKKVILEEKLFLKYLYVHNMSSQVLFPNFLQIFDYSLLNLLSTYLLCINGITPSLLISDFVNNSHTLSSKLRFS